jgi:hypothetical protein
VGVVAAAKAWIRYRVSASRRREAVLD